MYRVKNIPIPPKKNVSPAKIILKKNPLYPIYSIYVEYISLYSFPFLSQNEENIDKVLLDLSST